MADEQRDYVRISQSSLIARTGVLERNINTLAAGVALIRAKFVMHTEISFSMRALAIHPAK